MCDPLGVEELEGGGNVPDDEDSLRLGEVLPGGDPVQKLAPCDLLKHQIKGLWLLKILDQVDNILMALQQIKYQSLTSDIDIVISHFSLQASYVYNI